MAESSGSADLRHRLCQWLQSKMPQAEQLQLSEFTVPEAGASNETLLFSASLGRTFYVMERVEGRYLADNPPCHMDGWLTECSPRERGAIWRNTIREIARISKVDWQGRGFGEICGYAPYDTPLQAQLAEYEVFSYLHTPPGPLDGDAYTSHSPHRD